jgi:hypothetical protein
MIDDKEPYKMPLAGGHGYICFESYNSCKLHCVTGPAYVDYLSGVSKYFIHGREYSSNDFYLKISDIPKEFYQQLLEEINHE